MCEGRELTVQYICPNCDTDMTDQVQAQCGAVLHMPRVMLGAVKAARGTRPASVILQCPNGHWAEYPCPSSMPSPPPTIRGRPVSAAEREQLSALQALFNPADALKRIDVFAKWIFASIAVVGTLGAGLSNAAFATLSGVGKLLLGLAVLSVGASLFAATLALVPQWVDTVLCSRDSMLAALDDNLRKRRTPLRCAGGLFALALGLAGAVPLASVVSSWSRAQSVALNYEWKAGSTLSAQFTAAGLEPYCPVELSVQTAAARPVEQARVRKAADESGNVDATLDVPLALPPETAVQVSAEWADSPGPSAPLNNKETVATMVPNAEPASATPPETSEKTKQTARGTVPKR